MSKLNQWETNEHIVTTFLDGCLKDYRDARGIRTDISNDDPMRFFQPKLRTRQDTVRTAWDSVWFDSNEDRLYAKARSQLGCDKYFLNNPDEYAYINAFLRNNGLFRRSKDRTLDTRRVARFTATCRPGTNEEGYEQDHSESPHRADEEGRKAAQIINPSGVIAKEDSLIHQCNRTAQYLNTIISPYYPAIFWCHAHTWKGETKNHHRVDLHVTVEELYTNLTSN